MSEGTHFPAIDKAEWWETTTEITRWPNKVDTRGGTHTITWAELYGTWQLADTFKHKGALPGWSPATFEGGRRKKVNVLTVGALVLDYEDKTGGVGLDLNAIHEQWSELGHLIHSSYSHGLPHPPAHKPCGKRGVRRVVDGMGVCEGCGDKIPAPDQNRYRAILPLSRRVSPDEYRKLLFWAYDMVGMVDLLDETTSDPSRLWYVPALRPNQTQADLEVLFHDTHRLLDVEGLLADLAAFQAPVEEIKPVAPRPRPATPPPQQSTRGASIDREKGRQMAYAAAALQGAITSILQAPEGKRNETLNLQAFSVGGLVGADLLSVREAEDALLEAVQQAGWPQDKKNTACIRRALADGIAKPRPCPPPREPLRYQAPPPPPPAPSLDEAEERIEQLERDLEDLEDELLDEEAASGGPPSKPPSGGGDGGGLPKPYGDERPMMRTGADRFKTIDEAMKHLGDTQLFHRGGELVLAVRDWVSTSSGRKDHAAPQIRPVSEKRLLEIVGRRMQFESYNQNERDYLPCTAPAWLAAHLHQRGEWEHIRPLRGVTETPVLRPDGTVLDVAGYDPTTGLMFTPRDGLNLRPVPEQPTAEDVKASLARLFDVVCDFPFEERSHRSAWLAGLLTPLARSAFEGTAPLFLVDANIRAAGKGKLCNLIGLILNGSDMPTMAWTPDDAEIEKRIMSIGLAGDRLTLIDDVNGTFGSPSLNNALTAPVFRGRKLGSNEMASVELKTTWFATGNNVQLFRDMSRRVCHVRLLSNESNPEKRADLKYPNLYGHVRANQSELLWSALVLLRAWFAAGKPRQQLQVWGSMEGWSDVVRQAIVWLGEPDPAETRQKLDELADTEGLALADLIEAWGEAQLLTDHLDGMTVTQALAWCESRPEEAVELIEALCALCPPEPGKKLPKAAQLGRKITHLADRVVTGHQGPGRRLSRRQKRDKSGVSWTVEAAPTAPAWKIAVEAAPAAPAAPLPSPPPLTDEEIEAAEAEAIRDYS